MFNLLILKLPHSDWDIVPSVIDLHRPTVCTYKHAHLWVIADCVDHLFYFGRSVLAGHVWLSTSCLCVFPCLLDVIIGFACFPSVFPPSLVYLCLSRSLFVSLSVFTLASVMWPLSFNLCFTCICCLRMSLPNPVCIQFCTLLSTTLLERFSSVTSLFFCHLLHFAFLDFSYHCCT